jgi:hypothetical protein
MADCAVLSEPHLNVSGHPADGEVARMLDIVANEQPVDRLETLQRLLEELAACPEVSALESRTLDLIGHSDERRLLHLGRSVLDLRQAAVRQVFEQIAEAGLLGALRITELRLLGCETALSGDGQAVIRQLTDILGIRVLGTARLLYAAYFGDKGLKPRYTSMLLDAANLPPATAERAGWPQDPLPPRAPPFALERIRSSSIDELPRVDWPRIRRTDAGAGAGGVAPLADLVEQGDGRVMPHLLAQPRCEVLVVSGGDRVRRIEVLLDHELIRIRLADSSDSAVYRVRDPRELEDWLGGAGAS